MAHPIDIARFGSIPLSWDSGVSNVKHNLLSFFNPTCRWMTRHSARILMYHGFAPNGTPGKLCASVFEEQIRFLARHYRPCRMDQLVAWLQAGELLPPNLVAITIDDGYANFFEIAYPILKRYRIPATFYIVSNFVDQAIWLWFDLLKYQMMQGKPGSYMFNIGGSAQYIVLSDKYTRYNAWNKLADACLLITQNERLIALDEIGSILGVSIPDRPSQEFRAITWDQLGQLDPELIEIGSHTCSHPILTKCSESELENELTQSKNTIESELGRKVVSFCYPNGQISDYNPSVMQAVQKAGYTNAVVAHGTLVEANANRFALERISAPHNNQFFQYMIDSRPYLSQQKKSLIGSK